LPCVYITTRVTLELKSPAMGILFAAIAERPELLGWALRRLAVAGPVSWW